MAGSLVWATMANAKLASLSAVADPTPQPSRTRRRPKSAALAREAAPPALIDATTQSKRSVSIPSFNHRSDTPAADVHAKVSMDTDKLRGMLQGRTLYQSKKSLVDLRKQSTSQQSRRPRSAGPCRGRKSTRCRTKTEVDTLTVLQQRLLPPTPRIIAAAAWEEEDDPDRMTVDLSDLMVRGKSEERADTPCTSPSPTSPQQSESSLPAPAGVLRSQQPQSSHSCKLAVNQNHIQDGYNIKTSRLRAEAIQAIANSAFRGNNNIWIPMACKGNQKLSGRFTGHGKVDPKARKRSEIKRFVTS